MDANKSSDLSGGPEEEPESPYDNCPEYYHIKKYIEENKGQTFSEMVISLFDKAEAETPALRDYDIYDRGLIKASHFSKIKNNRNYKTTKSTVLRLAIALELTLDQTQQLLESAGFSLSDNNEEDLIVRYFIEKKDYNIADIDEAFKAFGLPELIKEYRRNR